MPTVAEVLAANKADPFRQSEGLPELNVFEEDKTLVACEIANIPKLSDSFLVDGVYYGAIFEYSKERDMMLMPLELAFEGEIKMFCEFEGVEVVLKVADEESLIRLREGHRGDVGTEILELSDELPLLQRNQKYILFEGQAQQLPVPQFQRNHLLLFSLFDHFEVRKG